MPPVLLRATVVATTLLLACDDTTAQVTAAVDGAGKQVDAAKQTAAQVADDASKQVDAAKQAVDGAGKSAADAMDRSKRAWAGLTDTGQLSKDALAWLGAQAEGTDMGSVVAKGVQVAPVALEIGVTINQAVDSETVVEPIYQPLDGRDPEAVDRAIAGMPRVEVVDGVKIGFSQLNRVDAGTSIDERAYLVTWRRETHLVGFVYRTKRTVDLEMLIRESPRLFRLTRDAIADETP
ncbi:MAG: hypothetical protein IPK74_39125 [Deltaproteobacteria bacterium]|nr:hypothetical protein [Deltaproteobacteria bacterium]